MRRNTTDHPFHCSASTASGIYFSNQPLLYLSFVQLYLAVEYSAIDSPKRTIIESAFAVALSPSIQRCRIFPDTGVTSLHPWVWMESDDDIAEESSSTKNLLIAGTKNGRILFAEPNEDWGQINTDDDSLKITKNRYPIYSLTSSASHLFCGAGNRYISVWSRSVEPTESGKQELFHYQQQLGPHTGWVKDLVYDNHNNLLHSIGCNCIETWDCFAVPFQHSIKRSIESSPTMGTTLSSDLLCLCLVESQHSMHHYLLSGGVDGRIHVWASNPADLGQSNIEPLCSITAHGGRVNKMLYSKAIKAILSVGNDGRLSVCRIRKFSDSKFVLEPISSLPIGQHFEKPDDLRLTALSIVGGNTNERECSVALGTSCGKVFVATLQETEDGDLDLSSHRTITQLEDEPLVYSLACLRTETDRQLWVGHATGLVSVDIL